MSRGWTEEQKKYLIESYGVVPIKEIMEKVGKKKSTVRMYAKSLGLTQPTSEFWSEEDIEKLKSLVDEKVSSAEMSVLLSRSESSVLHKMSRLGLKSQIDRAKVTQKYFKELREDDVAYALRYQNKDHYNSWSVAEDSYLREHYATHTARQIGESLGRSVCAVKLRAHHLNLKKGYQTGENHAAWKGGKKHHSSAWRRLVRPVVLERDGWTCQECGLVDFAASTLRVHHILPSRLSFDDSVSNHVTLCNPCHVRQKAHKWDEITEEGILQLPEYQRAILQVKNVEKYVVNALPDQLVQPYDKRV